VLLEAMIPPLDSLSSSQDGERRTVRLLIRYLVGHWIRNSVRKQIRFLIRNDRR